MRKVGNTNMFEITKLEFQEKLLWDQAAEKLKINGKPAIYSASTEDNPTFLVSDKLLHEISPSFDQATGYKE